MENYELFLKELSELCRKHDVEITIDSHATELMLICASEFKRDFPQYDSVLDKDYIIINERWTHFGL